MRLSLNKIKNIKNEFASKLYKLSPVVPPQSHNNDCIIAKGDSGASRHYFRPTYTTALCDIKPSTEIRVV